MSRVDRREFRESFAQQQIRVDQLPEPVIRQLESHGVDQQALQRIAGDDHLISGEEFTALYDALAVRETNGQRTDIAVSQELFQQLAARAERPGTDVPAIPDVAFQGSARPRSVGVGLTPGPNTLTARGPNAAEVPAQAPPSQPEVAPADRLAEQMMALDPARTGRHVPVRAYVDAMAARDEQTRLLNAGDRRGAAAIARPEGVPVEVWNLSRALQQRGLNAQDVRTFLATGTLPPGPGPDGPVDRMAELEQAARRQGSWTAVNSFTYLVGMRRSLMAAERQALTARFDLLPPTDPQRAELQAGITGSEQTDRDLNGFLQSMYRDASLAREQGGRAALSRSQTYEANATRLEAAGDHAGAARERTRAQEARDRAAHIAHSEATYRSQFSHFISADTTFQLAARAQIDSGRVEVTRLRETSGPLPAQLSWVQGTGDAANGVPSAEALLANARGSGGAGAPQLDLEIDRLRVSADFDRLATERSGHLARVDAQGNRPAARTDAGRAQYQRYLDARAQTASLLMERIGLYGPTSSLGTGDATAVGQLNVERAEILGELSQISGRSLSTDRHLQGAETRVTDLSTQVTQGEAAVAEAQRQLTDDRNQRTARYESTDSIFGLDQRDLDAREDADRIVTIREAQVAVTQAHLSGVRTDLSTARDHVGTWQVQARRDAEDAQAVRTALRSSGVHTNSVADAQAQTRHQADASARAADVALDRAEVAVPPGGTLTTVDRYQLGAARAELSLYWTQSAEGELAALGEDAGRRGATTRLDSAGEQARGADAHRQAMEVGPARQALGAQLVFAESRLAAAESEYRPGRSRDLLAHAQGIADGDLAVNPARQTSARAQLAQAGAEALARRDGRLIEIVRAGNHDVTAADDIYRRTNGLLAQLPTDGELGRELQGTRDVMARFDAAFALAPQMFTRTVEQAQRGHQLASSYTRLMAQDEGDAAAASFSVVISLPMLPFVDLRGELRDMADRSAQNWVNQEHLDLAGAHVGAEDLGRGLAEARRQGRGFEFLDSLRIMRASYRDDTISDATFAGARDRMTSFLPENRRDGRFAMWAHYGVLAWNGGGTPLGEATAGPMLGYSESFRQLGHEDLAVVTRDSAQMMQYQAQSLQDTVDRMWVALTINTIGEVGLGIVLTGGIGSAAAVGEAANVANTARNVATVGSAVRTATTLTRLVEAAHAFRVAHPILYTAGVTAGVGTTMAGLSYAARRTFGRNSVAAQLADFGAVVIPIGAGNRAAGLSGAARRAATMGEGRVAQLRQVFTVAHAREALAMERLVAHARFYGPQMALGTLMGVGTLHGTPALAHALGVERSEVAQMAIGVLLNTAFASGGAALAGRGQRAAAASRAAELSRMVSEAQGGGGLGQVQRVAAERAATGTLERFERATEGRMPTDAELQQLRGNLARDLQVTEASAPESRAVLDGAIESFRIERATTLAVQGHDVGTLASDPNAGPAALQRAAEHLHRSRGGAEGSPPSLAARRDAALALRRVFTQDAATRLAAGDTAGAATSRAAADRLADQITGAEIAAALTVARPGREPVLGPREAARVETLLSTEVTEARRRFEATDGEPMGTYFSGLERRLQDQQGLTRDQAAAVVQTLRGELFQTGLRRELAARQAAAGDVPLSNADLSAAGEQLARRLGVSDDRARAIAREIVLSRPQFEGSGLILPGGETAAETAQRSVYAAEPQLIRALGPMDAETFVRTFGPDPNPQVLLRWSEVPSFAELARTDPPRARRLLEAAPGLDAATIARDVGIPAAELFVESPAAMNHFLRTAGAEGQALLRTDPAAARLRAQQSFEAYRGVVDEGGRLGFDALSGTESAQILRRAQAPRQPTDAAEVQLGPAELAAMGLEPRYRVTIDGTSMALSEPFNLHDGRRGIVAFIDDGGQTHAQIFYRSNSQAVWRTSDASQNGHYGKGLGETDTAVPLELNAVLHRMARENTTPLRDPEQRRLQDPTAETYGDVADRAFRGLTRAMTRETLRSGQIETHAEGLAVHYYTPEYAAAHRRQSVGAGQGEVHASSGHPLPDPAGMQLPPPGQRPDFSRPPEQSFTFQSDAYAQITGNGQLTGHIYNSRDGSLRYLVLEDSQGRISIGGAEAVNSPVTRWGNRESFIDLHGMDAPLFEYHQQISQAHGGARGTTYQLNWQYVRETPLVQEFYRQQGRPMPEALPESGQPLPSQVLEAELAGLPRHDARAVRGLLSPNTPTNLPTDVAARAREEMGSFVRFDGAESAQWLVRVGERVGPEPLAQIFAERGAGEIARHQAQITPEVLDAWARTPPSDRLARMRADLDRFAARQ